ncbi:beta-ketoacyl synthase N-terminal-like domain-containing protein [Streptomyces sp. NPDC047108]|uniref:type I polyketide synthase n=1 Tax=Streptomyces sp. NPDC047108 TaxID=3155025 RepID=UPI0033F4491D
MAEDTHRPGIAVVGMAVLLPGAPDLDTYWRNLVGGVDAISDVPSGRWDELFYDPQAVGRSDRVYCRRGGFVDDLAQVEVTRFGIMPNSVAGTEPDQLIALKVAADAIADAGGEDRLPDRERIGVILGRGGYLTPGLSRGSQRVRTANQLVRTLGELMPSLGEGQLEDVRRAFTERLGPDEPEQAIGLVPNLTASRVANRLDLRGPAYTVDAACASSLVAVDHAVARLSAGQCDVMLAGGVHHCHDITLWSVFAQLRALSPSQRIRPFDRGADGLLIGEGTGVVVLKRLADARRDGDRIYAVVRGTGMASDGRSGSLVNPDPRGQVSAVRQAWRAAGLDPAEPGSIGLLEAHGTAAPSGDAAELATVAEVFGPSRGQDRAAIGSVKSMIGHTMPAAGAAGLVKAALAVHHGVLPPTLHCEDPHPALEGTRFRPLASARPWESREGGGGGVRRAAVNAFGFGGINAHVVLEADPGAEVRRRPRPGAAAGQGRPATTVREPERVLRLAAGSARELAALLDTDDSAVLAAGLRQEESGALRPGAREGRPARLGIVDPTAKRLALARKALARGRPWRGRGDVWFTEEPLLAEPDGGRTAFMFPGLEAGAEPRVADVAEHFGLSTAPLALGDDDRPDGGGGGEGSGDDDVAGSGHVGRLGAHVVGAGRVLDAALRRMGIVPDAVAGHSVGEWTAMVAGGLFSGAAADAFLETFDPDELRVPGLSFAVLGAPADQVAAAVEDRPGVVLSHDNAPDQSMVCGPPDAVDELVRWFRARRVVGQVLPFRSGFHTPMLAPYLEPIRQASERFDLHPPTVPVWSATTATLYPREEARVRELFVRHLLEPVRFRPLVEAMHADGIRVFVQVGPGQLGALIGNTLQDRPHLTVAADSPHRGGLAQLRRVATALWAEGGEPAAEVLERARRSAYGAGNATGAGKGSGAGKGTGSGNGRRHPAVRLDLGGRLVSLDRDTLNGLRTALGERPGGAPAAAAEAAPGGVPGRAAELERAAARFPFAGELSALLRDTADTAVALIDAATSGATATPDTPLAPSTHPTGMPLAPSTHPTGTPHTPASADPPRTASTWVPAAPESPSPSPAPPAGPDGHSSVLRVSTAAMPYLLDHCFFAQRPGWPDESDRRPVVPATTVVHHMMRYAEEGTPGTTAVAVREVRLNRWVAATPPVDVPVTVTPAGPGAAQVAFGPYAEAHVDLAPRYPAGAPSPWRFDPAFERAPHLTADQLYTERWMFHGPRFQGVTELTAIGPSHVRGILTAPAAPGALLDNVGQLFGYWIITTLPERNVVFPVAMREIRFFGPHPAAGTQLDCLIRVTAVTEAAVEADVQLVADGRVWAEITGWRDRRFDNHPETRAQERFPERNTLSRPQPGGWSLVHDRWPDLASRDLVMRNHLGSAERDDYERCPPRRRRQWLLGRIAVKDAVRRLLWDLGEGPVFPAEIRVSNDESGAPRVTGVHGRSLPPLEVTLAHSAEAGVALVRPHRPGASGAPSGTGIDIEQIAERPPETREVALGPAERDLLAEQCAASGEPEAVWFTRFWAAKEAVAKAAGTGLRGRPRDFAVVGAAPDELLVSAGGREHRVRCRRISNPDGLPVRDYVVAWTAGTTEKERESKQ